MDRVQVASSRGRGRARIMAIAAALLVACEIALVIAAVLYAVGSLYFGLGFDGVTAIVELGLATVVGGVIAVRFGVSAYHAEATLALRERDRTVAANDRGPGGPLPPHRSRPAT